MSEKTGRSGAPRPPFRRGEPSYQVKGGQTRLTLNVPQGVAYLINEACEREEIGPSEFVRRLVSWYAFDVGRCDEFFAARASKRSARLNSLYPDVDECHVTLADAARHLLREVENLYGNGGEEPRLRGWSAEASERYREGMSAYRTFLRKSLDQTLSPEEAEELRAAALQAMDDGLAMIEADIESTKKGGPIAALA